MRIPFAGSASRPWRIVTVGAISGCASTSVLPERMSAPEAQIAAAKEAGAAEDPTAALHLKLSNDAVARAKALAREGKGQGPT